VSIIDTLNVHTNFEKSHYQNMCEESFVIFNIPFSQDQ